VLASAALSSNGEGAWMRMPLVVITRIGDGQAAMEGSDVDLRATDKKGRFGRQVGRYGL
jgi:hypothetical protein